MDQVSQPHGFESFQESSPDLGSQLHEPPPIPKGRQSSEESGSTSPVSDSEEMGERTFEEIAERAIQILRANPIPAVLGGLALGFVLGRLIRRH